MNPVPKPGSSNFRLQARHLNNKLVADRTVRVSPERAEVTANPAARVHFEVELVAEIAEPVLLEQISQLQSSVGS